MKEESPFKEIEQRLSLAKSTISNLEAKFGDNGESHVNHIRRNITPVIHFYLELKDPESRLKNSAYEQLALLETYVELLNQNEDYAKAEMSTIEGFYPDVRMNSLPTYENIPKEEYHSGVENYVFQSKKRLGI